MVSIRLSLRDRTVSGEVVSSTLTRNFAADLVFLAVHAQKLGVGEGGDVGFRGEHLGGVGRDVDAQIGGQRLGDGGRSSWSWWGSGTPACRRDAGQHRALDGLGRLRQVVADHLVHDGRGAGHGRW
jgi:hypothetical protein